MDTKELKQIIESVLTEMNISESQINPSTEQNLKKSCDSMTGIEGGILDDITEIDIKKQYLVENPADKEGFMELKQFAPCRLGIGKAGARYKTLPQLMFRAAHSAAQDAVFSDVDQDFVDNLGLFTIQSRCDNKDVYLTRPDLGRRLSEDAVATLKEKCEKNPQVQIFVSDGLSSAAVAANTKDVLSGITQGLKASGINVGTPFFVKYGRG